MICFLQLKEVFCCLWGHWMVPIADGEYKGEKLHWMRCSRCERDFVQDDFTKEITKVEK